MAEPDWIKDVPTYSGNGCPSCLKCNWPTMKATYTPQGLTSDWPELLLWRCDECGAGRYTRCCDYQASEASGSSSSNKQD